MSAAGPSGKGLNKPKSRQQRVNKSYYANQVVATERNKKRKVRNRIRSNPRDLEAVKRYELTWGRADTLGLSARGKKLARRYELEGEAR
jgi:hypothetical protein